jgi:endonuclease G
VDLPHVEATYLAWLDFRPWLSRMNGLSPAKFFLSHGVALMDGAPFGAPGFARLNFACRRALLEEALGRMSRSACFPNRRLHSQTVSPKKRLPRTASALMRRLPSLSALPWCCFSAPATGVCTSPGAGRRPRPPASRTPSPACASKPPTRPPILRMRWAHGARRLRAAPAGLATNQVLCAGLPKRLPNSPAPNDLTVLNKTGFAVAYSPSLRHPVWVAYHVYDISNAVPPPRPREFKPDPAAPGSPPAQGLREERLRPRPHGSHLAIATRFGKAAQAQTFLTSNICPQRPSLNQGPWCNLELRIAELWPRRFRDVWVIAGALSAPGGKRLPSGIDIPSAFYQIVVARKDNELLAFATLMPQNTRRRTYARSMLVSIDELEALTGFDFLSALPDDVESALESATPTRLWPAGPAGAARLLYERFRTYD